MANSFTALGFIKPEVGADTNLWGGHLNTDWDLADTLLQRLVGTTTTRLLTFNVNAVSTTTTRTITWSDVNLTMPTTTGTVALTSDVPPLIRSYLSGLTLSTAGSSATFGIAVGVAVDSTNVGALTLPSAFTKTTSAWAVGTGNGAMDTGTVANSTWYHVHLIKRVDTGLVDVLFSLSATAPTMPANYTLARRIGAMKTNGSAQWTSFVQVGNNFQWLSPVLDVNQASAGTSAVTRTLTVPTGLVVEPIMSVTLDVSATSAGTDIYLSALSQTDVAADGTNSQVAILADTGALVNQRVSGVVPNVLTNTSAQIRSRLSAGGAGVTLRLHTHGWIDRRGRDD